MRIGLVTHYMPPHQGGIEQIVESLFSGYAEAAIEVRWIASRVPSTAAARDGPRIRVRAWNGLERAFGVPLPIWSPEGWRELTRLVSWADVLHVHDCLYPSSAVAVALARRVGRPALLSQHVGFVRYSVPLLNWLERCAYATVGRATLRGASAVVLVTAGAERHVRALLPELTTPTYHIPSSVDTIRFHPMTPSDATRARARLGLPLDRPLVLFAGRLVEKKGIPLVLDVSGLTPDVHFLIVGDGPLRHLLRGQRPNVSWIPTAPHDTMPEYYGACDCVLLPSRDEGLPLVVQEAMASGRPVVISEDEPYASDLIRAGACVGGPRNAPALSALVRALADDHGGDIGIRARAYAERCWEPKTIVRRYLRILDDMVVNTPAGVSTRRGA